MAVRGIVKVGQKTLQHVLKKEQLRLSKLDPVESFGKEAGAGTCESAHHPDLVADAARWRGRDRGLLGFWRLEKME